MEILYNNLEKLVIIINNMLKFEIASNIKIYDIIIVILIIKLIYIILKGRNEW